MPFKVLDPDTRGEPKFYQVDDLLLVSSLCSELYAWSFKASPGDVFCTHDMVVVAAPRVRLDKDDICHYCGHEGLNYGDMEPLEGCELQQAVRCPECGQRWMDVFALTQKRAL